MGSNSSVSATSKALTLNSLTDHHSKNASTIVSKTSPFSMNIGRFMPQIGNKRTTYLKSWFIRKRLAGATDSPEYPASALLSWMAIRPVCVLFKHIINSSSNQFQYEFIPTGTVAMTTSDHVSELLINNNDIQKAIQGISIIGLPHMALELLHEYDNQVKTIEQWIKHYPGVENIEPTEETATAGRWIVIVLRSEYENACQWIEEVLHDVPPLMPDLDRIAFESS